MTGRKKVGTQIVFLLLCIVLNVACRWVGELLHLPIWLDCLGTYVAAYFAEPVITILTAVISQGLIGMYNTTALFYVVTATVVAVSFIHCVNKQYVNKLSKMVIASFWIGILCVICSTPLNIIFYNGYSGNMWGDALVDMLDWYGVSREVGAIAGEMIVEVVDKQICVIIAYGVVKLILLCKNRIKKKAKEKALSMLLFLMILCPFLGDWTTAYAKEDAPRQEINYTSTIYNNTSGMMSSEANVVAQTQDGYIWIGGYAGLTRYNGSDFEFIRDGGIVNVTAMLCDSTGRLWIGTNDGGIARYDNGEFTFFTVETGLPVNSIRTFAEDGNGNVYVGTTDGICCFDSMDKISFVDKDAKYIISMETEEDVLSYIDNNGNLFVLKNNELIGTFREAESGIFCQCMKQTSKGILVGTLDNRLYRLNVTENKVTLEKTGYEVLHEVCGIDEDEFGCIWICSESGFGYVDQSGKFTELAEENFNTSFEYIMEDYQGNIWLASSRYGVMKLSESRFSELFKQAGLEGNVVNAVVEYQDGYYCGTDTGLVVIGRDGKAVQNELTKLLSGDRIRCLTVDSRNQLWISTYGENGLVCVAASGKIENFTMAVQGTTSDRFRCSIELRDGTIVAGTADGINFIKNNQLIGKITAKEGGLSNSQILCLMEDKDGTLYVGSDGGGIYVVHDGEVTDTYTIENGLSSNVILRIVPYQAGYFVVTSNSLCYMENGNIRELVNFPYFNNYDVIIRGQEAYVLSSAGIYVADAGKIAVDENTSYELLGTGSGLMSALTANAWNYMDELGRIFLCSNAGVIVCEDRQEKENQEFRFGIESVLCDDTMIAEKDGVYKLPVNTRNIVLRASVQNYTLQDVKVKFYVDGVENHAEPMSYRKLEPIQISNLSHGTYKVHLQIYDNSGTEILQEKVYELNKEIQLWERTGYKIYLAFVCIELIVFATWTIINMHNTSKRKTELEYVRRELEEKVSLQIEQIKTQQQKENRMFRRMIVALSDTVDAKDRYTSGHSQRVADYAKVIAAHMGKSEAEQEEIYYAGLLHDIGKIRVPEAVINKPGKLTDEEFELIKIHPITGYRILKNIAEDSCIANGAKFHHERYDGKGYPNGLRGTNIPEIARIIGVADAYDAMASNRSYRNALPQDVVRAEIEKGSGTQFDPEIADVMLKLIDEDSDYKMKENSNINKTILVVDDEPMNIQMIQFILKDETIYQVSGVLGGQEALKFLETQNADLILLDIEMPQMNGFEAFQAIREKYDVPVVFTTSDKEIETIQKAAALGVDDYLTKPFLPAALKEIVHNVIHFRD